MKGCGLTTRNQGSNTSSHLQLLLPRGEGIKKIFIVFIHMYLILPVYLFFLRAEVDACYLSFFFSYLSCFNELYDGIFSHISFFFSSANPRILGGTSSATASSSRGYFCSHCILGGGVSCFFFSFPYLYRFFFLMEFFFVLWCAVACGKYPLFYYYFELRIDTYGVRRGFSRKPMLFFFFLFFALSLSYVLFVFKRDRETEEKKKTFYKQKKLYRSTLVRGGARNAPFSPPSF